MTEQLTETPGDTTAEPAAPSPTRVAWAMVPRVNLLPMEIIESRQFRRTKVFLGAGVLSALLIAGAGVLWAQQDVAAANDELVLSQAKVATLNVEKVKYAEVPKVLAEVDAAKSARAQALAADVLWYRYLNDLQGAQPDGVTLTGMTLTLSSTNGTANPPADPLTSHSIGTLSAGGTAEKYQQVASWLEAMEKITGVSSASLGNATKADGSITFGSAAVFTTDALSHRYDKKGR
jgi:hypothetical protein